jgi:large subunit ribosomal protein L31
MKQNTHPDYQMATIKCACGAEYNVRSTKQTQRLEICAACHPFFTGKQRFIDTAGRVEKFRQRYNTKKESTEVKETTEASA